MSKDRSRRAYKQHCATCGKSPSSHPNKSCATFQTKGCNCTDATCAFCVRRQIKAGRELSA